MRQTKHVRVGAASPAAQSYGMPLVLRVPTTQPTQRRRQLNSTPTRPSPANPHLARAIEREAALLRGLDWHGGAAKGIHAVAPVGRSASTCTCMPVRLCCGRVMDDAVTEGQPVGYGPLERPAPALSGRAPEAL